jgi:hypothetical protein
MIDPAAERKETLERIGDIRFNLLWRHAGVKRGDHHNWNVDIREKVHRHPDDRGYAHHENDEAEHDDEKWVPD